MRNRGINSLKVDIQFRKTWETRGRNWEEKWEYMGKRRQKVRLDPADVEDAVTINRLR